jgi:hypothetical protein
MAEVQRSLMPAAGRFPRTKEHLFGMSLLPAAAQKSARKPTNRNPAGISGGNPTTRDLLFTTFCEQIRVEQSKGPDAAVQPWQVVQHEFFSHIIIIGVLLVGEKPFR